MDKRKDISSLFDNEGNCLCDIDTYFDDDGDLIEGFSIKENYINYPPDSDIVKLYFAEEYASETHGNYNAALLYRRANY